MSQTKLKILVRVRGFEEHPRKISKFRCSKWMWSRNFIKKTVSRVDRELARWDSNQTKYWYMRPYNRAYIYFNYMRHYAKKLKAKERKVRRKELKRKKKELKREEKDLLVKKDTPTADVPSTISVEVPIVDAAAKETDAEVSKKKECVVRRRFSVKKLMNVLLRDFRHRRGKFNFLRSMQMMIAERDTFGALGGRFFDDKNFHKQNYYNKNNKKDFDNKEYTKFDSNKKDFYNKKKAVNNNYNTPVNQQETLVSSSNFDSSNELKEKKYYNKNKFSYQQKNTAIDSSPKQSVLEQENASKQKEIFDYKKNKPYYNKSSNFKVTNQNPDLENKPENSKPYDKSPYYKKKYYPKKDNANFYNGKSDNFKKIDAEDSSKKFVGDNQSKGSEKVFSKQDQKKRNQFFYEIRMKNKKEKEDKNKSGKE